MEEKIESEPEVPIAGVAVAPPLPPAPTVTVYERVGLRVAVPVL
jgi:hypothetical protein